MGQTPLAHCRLPFESWRQARRASILRDSKATAVLVLEYGCWAAQCLHEGSTKHAWHRPGYRGECPERAGMLVPEARTVLPPQFSPLGKTSKCSLMAYGGSKCLC